jgi:two-component system sensor histidine kinase/response regulator
MSKILVIEDETILREEVAEWLTLEGYETITAENGMAGLEAAFRLRPDLIVCDITMPLLDGYGVLLELNTNPATADIPFIFVTARAAHEDMRRGMDLGADDYLTKPFSRLELLNAVQTRLEKRLIQQQQRQTEVDQWQQAFEQEREQRLLKAKLVAMFSHDFRNPLSSILTSTSLLRDYAGRMDEERRLNHFNRIEGSVRQLLQMLDDMLVVAQMDSGKLTFTPEPLQIQAFIQQMTEEFQMIHSDTYRLYFESRVAHTVMADPRLLRQIATNLISNAIKYSPQGSEVRILLDSVDGERWMLVVQDQGIGIPEEDQWLLFEAFQRASNVGLVQGTGLGLAIVKQAAELHGGTVYLESEVGVGTRVSVVMPK